HVQREEHGEDRAEEQRREHREPFDDRAGEHIRVEVLVVRPDEAARVAEGRVRTPGIQGEEARREHEDDGEHLPPQALAKPVQHDRRHSTTSSYASSSVEVTTRTPKTSSPAATSSRTRRGTSARRASGN